MRIGVAGLLLAAACASFPDGIAPGMTRAEIEARFGSPAFERHDAHQWIVVYSTEPRGQLAYRAALDAGGRVTEVEQGLTTARFAQVQPGWSHDDVLDRFGPPADRRRLAGEEVWEYRYREDGSFDALISLFFDAGGRITKLENGPDPQHDPNIK